jgi:hypothetical protein
VTVVTNADYLLAQDNSITQNVDLQFRRELLLKTYTEQVAGFDVDGEVHEDAC